MIENIKSNIKETNWEKMGIYFAAVAAFITIVAYVADIKERVAKLEVKIEYLEKK
jgi:hypothetical protein